MKIIVCNNKSKFWSIAKTSWIIGIPIHLFWKSTLVNHKRLHNWGHTFFLNDQRWRHIFMCVCVLWMTVSTRTKVGQISFKTGVLGVELRMKNLSWYISSGFYYKSHKYEYTLKNLQYISTSREKRKLQDCCLLILNPLKFWVCEIFVFIIRVGVKSWSHANLSKAPHFCVFIAFA